MPPTAPAPITVALEEACISTRGVLAATLEIDSFDAAGTGATPPKAEAEATRAATSSFCIGTTCEQRSFRAGFPVPAGKDN